MENREAKTGHSHRDAPDDRRHGHKSHKRHRRGEPDAKRRHKKRRDMSQTTVTVTDNDVNDEEIWVEKNIDMEGESPPATDNPASESLKIKSRPSYNTDNPPVPPNCSMEASLVRDEWMLFPPSASFETISSKIPSGEEILTEGHSEPSSAGRNLGGSIDFFATLGSERPKRPQSDQSNPDKLLASSKELNTWIKGNKAVAEHTEPPVGSRTLVPGGPGSQWRMMRLRRVYETAEEDNRLIEDVAMDRFGSLEAFEQAKEERRVLDEREGRKAGDGKEKERELASKRSAARRGEKAILYTDIGSGASSRSSSFRRPGDKADSGPSTPSSRPTAPAHSKFDPMSLPSPVPSVMTPQATLPGTRALSPSSFNKLQAKVLRAKLMGTPDAGNLETQCQADLTRANGNVTKFEDSSKTQVEVLPTLDARGRLYDVGHGKNDGPLPSGNRQRKEKVETRDAKTGNIIRYNADDDNTSLGDMLRQERFGAGMADQKNLDIQFATSIATDAGFQNDLDYMDDNADRLGRKKMRSDAMKRQFAINDYKRTRKALASCPFCYGEDDSLPKAPIVALGTRVYLACTLYEELLPGHCLIVPIQHHLTMLECDDDVWDEVRNFMKGLMKMFAEQEKGVVFYETVLTLKWQKHSVIECVPVPWEQFDLLPGYFKESILMSESEWSQHKKLIDFSTRGGFRRMMVPNLPYFMVQFDYKGEKGYGHVIEGTNEATDVDGDEGIDEDARGGGEFPREIIGNILDLEPQRWRHPRRYEVWQSKDRISDFKEQYEKYDWTLMLGHS
ncbi:hypothetical protein DENSPDRAFT_931257 [Dentipellis sp. KUC8613]|nr:hypothetical protein DENSPDRAFT_931257 [Dentipellis sp. KUC8613]